MLFGNSGILDVQTSLYLFRNVAYWLAVIRTKEDVKKERGVICKVTLFKIRISMEYTRLLKKKKKEKTCTHPFVEFARIIRPLRAEVVYLIMVLVHLL